MIVDGQKIPIKITKRNIEHYLKVGYDNIKLRDVVDVEAKKLSKGCGEKVNVECDYCGKIVRVVFRDYYNYKYDKYSCVSCRQRKTSEYNLIDRQSSLYNRALSFCEKMGYKILTPKEDILNSDTRIIYECEKHGKCEAKIYNLIIGCGCLKCGREKTIQSHTNDKDDVYNYFKEHGSILLNKEDYTRWDKKNLKVICSECGEVYITSYGTFSHSNGTQVCPKCSSIISSGELKIKNYLISINVDFCMQHRFADCKNKLPLPFDFYLPKNNVCIEYDGEGHYKAITRGITLDEANIVLTETKQRDNIKTQYCVNNNINLIRIPYWEFDNVEKILEKELFT